MPDEIDYESASALAFAQKIKDFVVEMNLPIIDICVGIALTLAAAAESYKSDRLTPEELIDTVATLAKNKVTGQLT